jgi:hypothetical protein
MTEDAGPADLRERVLSRLTATATPKRHVVAWLTAAAAAAGLATFVVRSVIRHEAVPASTSSVTPVARAIPEPIPSPRGTEPRAERIPVRRRAIPPAPPPGLPLLEVPRIEPPVRVTVNAVAIETQSLEPQAIPSLTIRPIEIDGTEDSSRP